MKGHDSRFRKALFAALGRCTRFGTRRPGVNNPLSPTSLFNSLRLRRSAGFPKGHPIPRSVLALKSTEYRHS